MREILVEQPLTIMLGGGLLFVVLLMTGLRSGNRNLLIASAATLAITCVLLLTERMIESPRESLRRSLRDMAEAVRGGDVDELLKYVHSSAGGIRSKVERHYSTYQPQAATITKFWELDVTGPDVARVEFTVRVVLPDQAPVAYVVAELRKEHGRWKVANYSVHSPQEAILNRDRRGELEPLTEY